MCLHARLLEEPGPMLQPAASISVHFAALRDPRLDRTKAHTLSNILVLAICAIIAGANDWEAVAEFGRSRQTWFESFLELPNGIPSHDTFWRVFRVLDPEQFQSCFVNWMRTVSPLLGSQVIAIDGNSYAVRMIGVSVRPPSTWSAPGLPRVAWCWANAKWPISPTRSPPFQNYYRRWICTAAW